MYFSYFVYFILTDYAGQYDCLQAAVWKRESDSGGRTGNCGYGDEYFGSGDIL